MKVAVVDSGLCNLDSITRALQECGAEPVVTGQPGDLGAVDAMVLPGVGAYRDAMDALRESRLDQAIIEQVQGHGIPLLGVCLGMQLLASRGTEGGEVDGLGLIPGTVERLRPSDPRERVPHVGWDEVWPRGPHPLFEGVPEGADFYFVHSYVFRPERDDDIVAVTPYAGGITSVVGSGRVVGAQFHPEKSQVWGLRMLRNFLAWSAC